MLLSGKPPLRPQLCGEKAWSIFISNLGAFNFILGTMYLLVNKSLEAITAKYLLIGLLSSNATLKELNILYKNSYNRQYEWSREILHGISDKFNEGGYKIDITEIPLSSKKILSENDRLKILDSQIDAFKFTNLDFIIVSDSEASAIIFKSKSDIFHKTPVLLCSVPDFSIHPDFDNI